jgi:hypothetical protein
VRVTIWNWDASRVPLSPVEVTEVPVCTGVAVTVQKAVVIPPREQSTCSKLEREHSSVRFGY